MNKKINIITNKIIQDHSESLNSEILSKLNQARQKALMPKKHKFKFLSTWLIPVAAVTAFAFYLILPVTQYQIEQTNLNGDSYAIIKEMDVIEQFELVENLEFYQWLSTEEENSSI